MKNTILVILFLLLTETIPGKTIKSIKIETDWPAFIKKQDMVWETLPEAWYESAFMGNGTLGVMIYKEPGRNCIRFETGNSNVHDYRKSKGLYGRPRLLTGHFELHPQGEILNGTMRLDLWNAETRAEIVTTKGVIHIRSIVHSDEMVIVTQTMTEGDEKDFCWKWIPASAESPRYLYAKGEGKWISLPKNYTFNPQPEVTLNADGSGLSQQRLLAGGEIVVHWKETREKEDKRILWATLDQSYPDLGAKDTCLHTLKKAVSTGYKKLLKQHRKWWNAFYPASFLTLPEGVKENFYWAQLYKLASATRGDRALIDNTGPWLTETPWPNAWWNLNVQLTYWPLNTSNHLDLAHSLERTLYDNVDNLRQNVPKAYRDNSLAIGRATNHLCQSEPVGIPGIDKNAEIGLLTWACHNLWLIYCYRMDDVLLRDKLYPLLKKSVNYYLHFLYEEADGKLHLPATYSPEYGSAEDCNFDLALLRWGCQTLLTSAERLKINDPLTGQWKRVLEQLTPYPTDNNGLMIGRNTPYAFSHRHYSHLLAIYPLYLVNCEQEGGREWIQQSLNFWQGKSGAHQGYSLTGASSISSAIGNGNDALDYLTKLFGKFLSVNTFYKEAGPVIETPLSGAQAIHDMLLQSWGGKIRVFPAVPDAWQNVAYARWRTEGAFLVSAKRKDGKTEFIQIESLAGEPCVVMTDIPDPVFEGVRKIHVEQLGNAVYRIEMRKGETVNIHGRGSRPDYIIRPLVNKENNCFGKKRY